MLPSWRTGWSNWYANINTKELTALNFLNLCTPSPSYIRTRLTGVNGTPVVICLQGKTSASSSTGKLVSCHSPFKQLKTKHWQNPLCEVSGWVTDTWAKKVRRTIHELLEHHKTQGLMVNVFTTLEAVDPDSHFTVFHNPTKAVIHESLHRGWKFTV